MDNKIQITKQESNIVLLSFLLIAIALLLNITNEALATFFDFRLIDENKVAYYIYDYSVIIIGSLAYFILSFAARNKAVVNILRITAVVFLLSDITSEFLINTIKNSDNEIDIRITLVSTTLGIKHIIEMLTTCYLWGAVKRNYKLEEISIKRINFLIIFIYIIIPLITQTVIPCICNMLMYEIISDMYSIVSIITSLVYIILYYMIISPAIFCANSVELPKKEQYRFWNIYHLWWFLGIVLAGILSVIVQFYFK